MGAQLRAVRRRIRSVQSTAKITRAQELIASSRIIRAQQRVRDARPYDREITRAVSAVVSRSAQVDHPLRFSTNANRALYRFCPASQRNTTEKSFPPSPESTTP